MFATRDVLVALVATGWVACVEPMQPDDEDGDGIVARFSPEECTVLYPGPGGVDDGLVGVCHWRDDDDHGGGGYVYEYVRMSPDACRRGHAEHALDFRSDDPLCRILPQRLASHEPVLDTVH